MKEYSAESMATLQPGTVVTSIQSGARSIVLEVISLRIDTEYSVNV